MVGSNLCFRSKIWRLDRFVALIDDDIMCTSKILTDLCFTKQKIKTKNTFAKLVYDALVGEVCLQNIKKIVWELMVHNPQK